MDMKFKERFISLWRKYFGDAALPIIFYYTDDGRCAPLADRPKGHRCLIDDLTKVKKGESLSFDVNSIGCHGGRKYLGFTQDLMPDFEYFLSCGIEGKLPGERYKKSPDLVKEVLKKAPKFVAPASYIVFKRWDNLEKSDDPQVAVFFAKPDVLSGLFTLAGYDEAELNAVIAPFSAGCGSIVQYPYLEGNSGHPRAVLGMFDVSARPYVAEDELTFSIPMNKFQRMVDNMEESFLVTGSWEKVRKRI